MQQIKRTNPSQSPLEYPGRQLNHSWLINGESIYKLDQPIILKDLSQKIPLLAIGSNRNPHRLADHLHAYMSGNSEDNTVYGLKSILNGADIVYPAHISSYGVVTATIMPCFAKIHSWTLFLSLGQLSALCMQEKLGEWFDLYRLSSVHVQTEVGIAFNYPLAFVARNGILPFSDNLPRRLWRVASLQSSLRRVSQNAAHKRAGKLLGSPDLKWPLANHDCLQTDRVLAAHGLATGWKSYDLVNRGQSIKFWDRITYF